MHREDNTRGGVGVFEFFRGQPQRNVIGPQAAVFFRNAKAKQVRTCHRRKNLRVHLLFAVEFLDVGQDNFLGQFTGHVAHGELGFGIREINHLSLCSLIELCAG